MKRLLIIPLTAALLAIPASVVAQEEEEVIVTVISGDEGTARDVQSEFVKNAPKRQNDNGLPRFAIVGKDKKFYLGIGAQFLGEGIVDFGDNMPSPVDFIPSSLTPSAPGSGAALRFTALTSSFHINAVAMPGTKNRIGLFFKAEINDGNDYGFDVSHFYITYRGFQVGYTSSLFNDGAAMPYTIDSQGPNGSADFSVFTAGYIHEFTPSFSGAIGIEAPSADITTGNGTANVSQRAPAIPLYLQYGWGDGASHLRLSGLVRPMQYRDVVAGKNHTPVGWGVQLSGLAKVMPALTFYYDATYGEGIAEYLQDDEGLGLDAVPDMEKAGRCRLMKSMGLTAGMTVNLTSRLAFNGAYSHLTNWAPDGAAPGADQYRYGDYVAANLIYTVNKIVGVGIEYDYGHRKSFDGASLHANRLQAQLAVTF